MSTNSLVAYQKKDGSVVSSYVHYDGYVTGVGLTLLEHYNTEEKAFAVSTAGYFSSLSENMEESRKKYGHNYEGDHSENTEEFEEYIRLDSGLEYVYIWEHGCWMVADWKLKVTGVGKYAKYESTWNGFSDLISTFVIEGRESVERYRSLDSEYEDDDKRASVIFSKIISEEKCFILNLESALALGDAYYQGLFAWLNVKTNFSPKVINSNKPYIKQRFLSNLIKNSK